MNKKTIIILSIILLSFSSIYAKKQPVPNIEYRVTDLTGTLTKEEISILEQKLQTFQDTFGSEVILVIVPTTGDESIEEYTIRLAEKWKVGREDIDDGVILLVAKNDRTVRIEVGYGLEGAISDAQSSKIIRNNIVPKFKEGDFYTGIENGISKILYLIEIENLPPPKKNKSKKKEKVKEPKKSAFSQFINDYQNENYLWQIILNILTSLTIPLLVLFFLTHFFLKKKIKRWSGLFHAYIVFIVSFILMDTFFIFASVASKIVISIYFSIVSIASTIIKTIALFLLTSKSSGSYESYSSNSSSSYRNRSSSRSSSSSNRSSSNRSSSSNRRSSSSSRSKKYKGGGGSFGGGGASGSW